MNKQCIESPLSLLIKDFSSETNFDYSIEQLWNSWEIITSFFCNILVPYYVLNKIDKDSDLDSRINDFFKGKLDVGNQYLDLASNISLYIIKNKIESSYFISKVTNLNFDDFKVNINDKFINEDNKQHIKNVLYDKNVKIFSKISFLKDSKIIFSSENKQHDLSIDSQDTLFSDLVLDSGHKHSVSLYPFFIFQCINDQSFNVMLFKKFNVEIDISSLYVKYNINFSRQQESIERISNLVIDVNKSFEIRNYRIFNSIFKYYNQISSNPYFSEHYVESFLPIDIKLFRGSFICLNSYVENDHLHKYATVIIMTVDKMMQTTAMNQLLAVEEGECIKKIKNYDIKEGEVYALTPDKLKFDKLIFCPIYSTSHSSGPDISIIEKTISNILSYISGRKDISYLICPDFGEHWGGDLYQKIPQIWTNLIVNNETKDSLKGIFFCFSKQQSMVAYKHTFSNRVDLKNLEDNIYNLTIRYIHNKTSAKQNYFQLYSLVKSFVGRYEDYRSKLEMLPYPVATKASELFARCETYCNNKDFVDKSLSSSLIFMKISTAIFIRLCLFQKKISECNSTNKILNEFHKTIIKRINDYKIYNIRYDYFDLSPFKELARRLLNLLLKVSSEFDKNTRDDVHCIKSFFNAKSAYSITGVRNQAAHEYDKNDAYYAKLRKFINEVVNLKKVFLSAFYMNSQEYELVHIEEFGATDDEDEEKWQIGYTSLCGINRVLNMDRLIVSDLDKISEPPGLRTNRVYLLYRSKDIIRFYRLHPFLYYYACPSCKQRDLFVWSGFDVKDCKPVFESTTCDQRLNAEQCLELGIEDEYFKISNDFWMVMNKFKMP